MIQQPPPMLEPNALKSSCARGGRRVSRQTYQVECRGSARRSPRHGADGVCKLGAVLPPTSVAEPPGIHLAHVAHTDDANHEVLHARRHSWSSCGGHVGLCSRGLSFCSWHRLARERMDLTMSPLDAERPKSSHPLVSGAAQMRCWRRWPRCVVGRGDGEREGRKVGWEIFRGEFEDGRKVGSSQLGRGQCAPASCIRSRMHTRVRH